MKIKSWVMMGVTLGLLSAASYAATPSDHYLNPQNMHKVIDLYEHDVLHRFDNVLSHQPSLKNTLGHLSFSDSEPVTQANVNFSQKECTVDVNLSELQKFLSDKKFSDKEINMFVKFAMLHERFHCVVFDDKESVWLPGSQNHQMTTDIIANHKYSTPTTMLTPHVNAYLFIHEELADGMAFIATLQDIISTHTGTTIGAAIPPEYLPIIRHIAMKRLLPTQTGIDDHGTFRMLDFILKQPLEKLSEPLSSWYVNLKQKSGEHLFENYATAGMSDILSERDMAYNFQASVITAEASPAVPPEESWSRYIVSSTKASLIEKGVVDHNDVKKIQSLIKGNTQEWVNSIEWRHRTSELNAINDAYAHYQKEHRENTYTMDIFTP